MHVFLSVGNLVHRLQDQFGIFLLHRKKEKEKEDLYLWNEGFGEFKFRLGNFRHKVFKHK